MRILSLGAGVQSSTLLLMAAKGEIEPIDAAIFADTQWEPRAVYDWLEVLRDEARAAGIDFLAVTAGNIRDLTLSPAGRRFASLPLYLRQPDGQAGMGRRQCTKEYKIRPIQRAIRAMGATRKAPVSMLIGISLDEYQRARGSIVQYVNHEFPLLDLRMTRADCVKWLERRGYPEPAKSSCIGCPFHRDAYWREMRAQRPSEWADAVDFDNRIRTHNSRMRGEQFVHRSLVPLDEARLGSDPTHDQLDMFDGCGVLCAADEVA